MPLIVQSVIENGAGYYSRDNTWPQFLLSDFLVVLGHPEDRLYIIGRHRRVIGLGGIGRELDSLCAADFPYFPFKRSNTSLPSVT